MMDFDQLISSKQSPFYEFPDFNNLIGKIDLLLKKVDSVYEKISKAMPQPFTNDVRLSAISRISLLVEYMKLSLTFLNNQLLPLNNLWWKQDLKINDDDDIYLEERSVLVNGFNNGFVKFGTLQHLFANIDNACRIFLRELDSTVLQGSTKEFQSIYDALKKRTSSFPAYSDDLVKLLRLSRNTIHNNGVYFHNKGNEQVSYKSKLYNFDVGKPINFVSWNWLFEMIEDVLYFLEAIIYDPKIITIKTEIIDPFLANRK